MSNWSGKTIGKVQLGEMIARGGMAEVYYGEHTTLNRKVAVKIMRDFGDADAEANRRFEREAQVIANLRHPNIIQIFDYELVEDHPFLVMELVPNISLGGYLRNLQKRTEKLPFSTIAQILTSLASAIDYAHSQNIVHRDIKPANVLLRSKSGLIDVNQPLPDDTEPVLTDFGLVRLMDASHQTSTGTVSGTPAYMSPEQARGDKVDKKTDIYSLGVVLYEMLAGNVPFDAESSFGVLMKHLNEPPPPIDGISPDLKKVINRALAKDASTRYDSAKEMVDEFIAVFNGQTISVETHNLNQKVETVQTEPAKQKSWVLPIVLANITLVAIAIVAFFATRPSPLTEQNRPLGRVSLSDFNAIMDKATFSFTDLPPLDSGSHYDVWYLSAGGEVRRNVGTIQMNDARQGQLVYIAPNQENIFRIFDHIEITVEADNDPQPDESSGNIVASSVFPPLALIHVRHVLVAFAGAPEDTALIQGVWASADEIDNTIIAMQETFTDRDEAGVRKLNEDLILQLQGNIDAEQHHTTPTASAGDVGNLPVYPDFDEGSNNSFGLLGVEETGYIPNILSHTQFAMDASDATEPIKNNGAQVLVCIENMQGWAEQLLDMALDLQDMPFDTEMQVHLDEMRLLSNQILFGTDSNGNGIIEPIAGEGGGDTAYQFAYYMADMPILLGENRMPLPRLQNP
jgi:serine/threonine protein kinase